MRNLTEQHIRDPAENHTKKLKELVPGDIIKVHVLFAENTRDYYNGYTPEEIRGGLYTDRFGQSGKDRMIIYLGRDGKSMCYLPLTTKHGSFYDLTHQYELKDNSMTEKSSPNLRSFVEVDRVRMMKVAYDSDLHYIGHTAQEDLDNLFHRISNNTLQIDGLRDQRGYVPDSMFSLFEQELFHSGYKKVSTNPYRAVYTKKAEGQKVIRTENGMVHYHKERTKDEIRKAVFYRERHRDKMTEARQKRLTAGKTQKAENRESKENISEFSKNIQALTEKEETTYAATY